MEAMQALLVQERREKAELERSMKLELDAQKLHLEMVINNHQLEMNAMQTMKTTHQRDAELKLSRMILELDIQVSFYDFSFYFRGLKMITNIHLLTMVSFLTIQYTNFDPIRVIVQ